MQSVLVSMLRGFLDLGVVTPIGLKEALNARHVFLGGLFYGPAGHDAVTVKLLASACTRVGLRKRFGI